MGLMVPLAKRQQQKRFRDIPEGAGTHAVKRLFLTRRTGEEGIPARHRRPEITSIRPQIHSADEFSF